MWAKSQDQNPGWKLTQATPHLFHLLHVGDFLGELPVLHELEVVGLELILKGGHVVAVLLTVLGQRGHLEIWESRIENLLKTGSGRPPCSSPDASLSGCRRTCTACSPRSSWRSRGTPCCCCWRSSPLPSSWSRRSWSAWKLRRLAPQCRSRRVLRTRVTWDLQQLYAPGCSILSPRRW